MRMKKLCLCAVLAAFVMVMCGCAVAAGFENDRRDVNNPDKVRKIETAADGVEWHIWNYGRILTEVPAPSRQKRKIRTPWAIVRKFYGTGEDAIDRKTADINYLTGKGISVEEAEKLYSVEYTYKYAEKNRIYTIAETIYLDPYGNAIRYETDNVTRYNVKDSPIAREALKYASEAEDYDIPVFIADTSGSKLSDPVAEQWHPSAKCRITSWTYNERGKKIELTILHKSSGKTTQVSANFKTTKNDRFFLVNQLPSGLQVVMPDDSEGTWIVNVDARKGYVAKITDPNNISASKLDSSSNKDDYGGKTFESGEAFIILKSSGMTIRPPAY